jgi:hypothetical protein
MLPPPKEASAPRGYWRGLFTLAALGVLTWLELGLAGGPVPALLLLGLGKASLILHYFMHIARLWKQD